MPSGTLRRRVASAGGAAPESRLLLRWYDVHQRALPWRVDPGVKPDPYAVWLSEIMLQQTTVATVKAYFGKFMARWPRVTDLAEASEDEILRAWAGLGYYARARNLHACARLIATDFGGRFPETEAELRELPGVGPYTSAAIAAIGFGKRAVVVDGNVERVVSRLFAIEAPLPRGKSLIREAADRLTPADRAGDFAQGMMDLGATVCTPRSPACAQCPLSISCAGRVRGDVESFPRKARKMIRPRRFGVAFFAYRPDGAVLVRTRPPRGLLGGMTEIPGSAWLGHLDLDYALKFAPIDACWRPLTGEIEHAFTHFTLTLRVFAATARPNARAPEGMRWSGRSELDREALPTLFRKAIAFARGHIEDGGFATAEPADRLSGRRRHGDSV